MIENIITNENLFLIVLGLVWIVGAVLQDLKRREVDNIWNFSLIGFALAYRFAVSIWGGNYLFVLNGLIGLLIFFVLGNLFYYSRLFAGGDAKLVMALGPVLTLSYDWIVNLKIFAIFILGFLVFGSIYALVYSFGLILVNLKKFEKEFVKQLRNYKSLFFSALGFVILWVVFAFYISQLRLIFISFVILLFPILFVFAKAVEESCMVKKISPSQITIGDWLYRGVKVRGKKIRANWEGVSRRELNLIRKNKKKILIKQGIPFTPAFLLGLLGLLVWCWYGGWFL